MTVTRSHAVRGRIAIAAFTIVIGAAGAAGAAPILDQQYEPLLPGGGLIVSPSQPVAQTFTVGLTGLLTSVDVQLARRNPAPAEGVLLSIVDAPSGIPDYTTILASVMIAPSAISPGFSFISVDLSTALLNVAVGDRLAIWLTTTAVATGGGINPYAWGADLIGLYAGGGAYTRSGTPFTGRDMGFRTYVDPEAQTAPEPAALMLLGMGFAATRFARRRK